MAPDRRPVVGRPALRSDERQLGAVLADAFWDDPLFTWFHPDPGSRRRALQRFFTAELRANRSHGRILTTTDVRAAGVWAPPNRWKTGPLEALRMLPASVTMIRNPRAAIALFNEMERRHPQEPHWYLSTVGADPASRGRGHGRAVIQPVLDDCDREGVPAYLESSKFENIPYYERFGFRPMGEITKAGSPVLTMMWREPRPPADG